MSTNRPGGRIVPAVHGLREVVPDPDYVRELAADLRASYTHEGLLELYGRFSHGHGAVDATMRRVVWSALVRSCGDGLRIEPSVGFKHPETFEIGAGVFIGTQAFIQGRFDGHCKLGDRVWIGPLSYLDARDLELGDHVGWGPGAKVLGSTHTAISPDIPIIDTDLEIKPVRIEAWADVGTGAVLLPGITVGQGAIVGAGAVVTRNVPALAKVAGVPARIIGWRGEKGPPRDPQQ